MIIVDVLTAQAVAGHGLWIGLFEAGTDRHCTIVHLGKQASKPHVYFAIEIAKDLAEKRAPIKAWKQGIARLVGWGTEGDPHVILLQPKDVLKLHLIARTKLLDADIPVKEEPYLPHVTIARVAKDGTLVIDPINRAPLYFDRVRVVCGDVHAEYPFKAPSSDTSAF